MGLDPDEPPRLGRRRGASPTHIRSMSSPTQPRTVDGRFGTVDHPADPGVYLAGPTTDDLALSAQLDAEVRSASVAQARVQLLLVEFAADGVLRQWPEAAYLQMDYSDQEYGAMVPVAVLDADGQELDDGMELWDDLDNGADLSSLVGNLNDEDDVWSDYRTHYNDTGPLVGQ